MSHTALVIIFTILMVIGIPGVFVPIIPALGYMFVIALIFAFLNGFTYITLVNLLTLAGLVAISVLIDYLSGVLGARYGGARRQSVVWGLVGTVIGFVVFPPLGGIMGLFLGILISELVHHRPQDKALRAATAGVIGSMVGIGINALLALVFVGLFIWFALGI